MIRELEEIQLAGNFELLFKGFGVDTDTHRGQLVAAFCDGVPNEDVAVHAVHWTAIFGGSFGDPIIVISGPHFVGVAVFKDPADADYENGGVFLHDGGFALLAGQVGVSIEYIFGVDEGKLFRKVGIFVGF